MPNHPDKEADSERHQYDVARTKMDAETVWRMFSLEGGGIGLELVQKWLGVGVLLGDLWVGLVNLLRLGGVRRRGRVIVVAMSRCGSLREVEIHVGLEMFWSGPVVAESRRRVDWDDLVVVEVVSEGCLARKMKYTWRSAFQAT